MYVEGKPQADYAAIYKKDGRTLQGRVSSSLAQAAGVVAILAILIESEPQQGLWIASDSDWVIRTLINWLPVWLERGLKTGEGKPVTYGELPLLPGSW